MTRDEALKLLQLPDEPLAPLQVRVAFARRCREYHPDTGTPGATTITMLKQARGMLEKTLVSEIKSPCKTCNSKGIVVGRLGIRSCTSCYGTGETQ